MGEDFTEIKMSRQNLFAGTGGPSCFVWGGGVIDWQGGYRKCPFVKYTNIILYMV